MSVRTQSYAIAILLVVCCNGTPDFLATLAKDVAQHLHIRDVLWVVDNDVSLEMAQSAVRTMKWFNGQGKNFQILSYSLLEDECESPNRVYENRTCYDLNQARQVRIRRVSTRSLLVMELGSEGEAFLTKMFNLRTHMYIIDMGFGYLDYRMNPVWMVYVGNVSTEDMFAKMVISSDQTFLSARQYDSGIKLEDIYHLEDPFNVNIFKKKIKKEPYTTEYGPNPVISHWGWWNATHGLNATNVPLLKRRSDLKGALVRFGIEHRPPFTLAFEEGGRMKPKGLMYEIWDSMQKQLNFTTEYRKYKTFTIMIDVTIGETQVALVDEISHSYPTCDYSGPLYRSRIEAIYMDKSVAVYGWSLYLYPFSIMLWMAFLLLLVLLALVLWLIQFLVRRHGIIDRKESDEYSILSTIFNVFNAYIQQGNEVMPTCCSSRMVYLATYLVAVIIMIAYTSDIISVLTQHKRVPQFHNIDEIIMETTYKVRADLVLIFHLKKINSRLNNYLIKNYKLGDIIPCVHLTFKTICDLPLWCLLEDNQKLFYAKSFPCDVATLPVPAEKVYKSLVLSKRLLHKGLIKKTIAKITEGGIIQNLLNQVRPTEIPPREQVDLPAITMEIVRPILVVLSVGLLTTLIISALELFVFRIGHKKLRPITA